MGIPPLIYKNTLKIQLTFVLVVLSISLLIPGCSSKSSTSPQSTNVKINDSEQVWLEKFFTDLFLEESAIYTLWGSKPITTFEICLYSPEELQEIMSQIPDDQKGETTIIENYDLPENWNKWEQFSKSLNVNRYLLFKKDNPNDPKLPSIFFVNVLETAFVLQENYSLFKNTTGKDFDCLEVVFEIQDKDSRFWNEVFKHSYLVGILYGFGKDNSLCFHWKYRRNNEKTAPFSKALQYHFSDEFKGIGTSRISDFSLPVFSSFFREDKVVNLYTNEREVIKNRYQNKDFVTLTLEKLLEN